MSGNLYRVTMQHATFGGGSFETMTITGYDPVWETEVPTKREIVRPVDTDEPNSDIEVGYSKNALEPLTIEFCGRRIEFTVSTYRLFRYVNDLYRMEGQTEFEFAELSEVLTGRESGKSKIAIGKLVRNIAAALVKIGAPIFVTYNREVLYITDVVTPSQKSEVSVPRSDKQSPVPATVLRVSGSIA